MIGRALRAFAGTKGKTFPREKCEAMRRALTAALAANKPAGEEQ